MLMLMFKKHTHEHWSFVTYSLANCCWSWFWLRWGKQMRQSLSQGKLSRHLSTAAVTRRESDPDSF